MRVAHLPILLAIPHYPNARGMKQHVKPVENMAIWQLAVICLPWRSTSNATLRIGIILIQLRRQRNVGSLKIKGFSHKTAEPHVRTILANYCSELQFGEDKVDAELDWPYLVDETFVEDGSAE